MAEALAHEDVAAALANPEEPPLLVYQGNGVLAAVADDESGSSGGAEAAGARPSEVVFAEYVLDSALVGAVQDAVTEGWLLEASSKLGDGGGARQRR